MSFRILIHTDALRDLQENQDWYNKQKEGLGNKFIQVVLHAFNTLETHPYFQIRYDDVRCLPLPTFPFMIHFTIDESSQVVNIYGVLHTNRNPKY